jgi:hypothetical protein
VVNTVLAVRFNIPSSDGILYSLPFAVAEHPLDLGIPFLDNFAGYGSSWGHHWPGAMWLKGVLFMALPYSRAADVAVLSIFQWLAAATAAWLVWKTSGKMWPAVAAMILILSDRLLLLACAGNRFESIAVAVVLLLFANSVTGFGKRGTRSRAFACLLAFLCPTLHPYALVMGALILGHDWLYRNRPHGATPRDCAARAGAFALGCLAVTAWFATQPDAMRQFTANLATQKSFYQNWNSVIAGLGNYRLGGGLLLWGLALPAAACLVSGLPKPQKDQAPLSSALRFLAPTLFVSVILIHTATRCENFTYLAFGSPFAVIMLCGIAGRVIPSTHPSHANAAEPGGPVHPCPPAIRWPAVVLLAMLVLTHATILPFRFLQFSRAGCPDLNAAMTAVLAGIPAGRAVYIPHPCWPAAVADRQHEIRWFTLPIASPRELRDRYEQSAYAKAKPGDVLIVDGSTPAPDLFGLYPTFPLHPPDPARWRLTGNEKQLFQGSVPWGLNLALYEFTGNP